MAKKKNGNGDANAEGKNFRADVDCKVCGDTEAAVVSVTTDPKTGKSVSVASCPACAPEKTDD